jgi:hypothetical protein
MNSFSAWKLPQWVSLEVTRSNGFHSPGYGPNGRVCDYSIELLGPEIKRNFMDSSIIFKLSDSTVSLFCYLTMLPVSWIYSVNGRMITNQSVEFHNIHQNQEALGSDRTHVSGAADHRMMGITKLHVTDPIYQCFSTAGLRSCTGFARPHKGWEPQCIHYYIECIATFHIADITLLFKQIYVHFMLDTLQRSTQTVQLHFLLQTLQNSIYTSYYRYCELTPEQFSYTYYKYSELRNTWTE